jgi:hypothetical protein
VSTRPLDRRTPPTDCRLPGRRDHRLP